MENNAKIHITVVVDGCEQVIEYDITFKPSTLLDVRKMSNEISGVMFAIQQNIVGGLSKIGACRNAEYQVMDKLGVDIDKARQILAIMNSGVTNE